MLVGGQRFPVSLRNLPTVVETYKTLDDENLVKVGDIGQTLLVRPPDTDAPSGGESVHGVTPAMANARQKRFRPCPTIPPEEIARVEDSMLRIMNGGSPAGVKYVDVEEAYFKNPSGEGGSWKPIHKKV